MAEKVFVDEALSPGDVDKLSVKNQIEDRQTNELIIGFCGPLGGGTSTVAKKVKSILESFNYKCEILKVSDLLSQHVEKVMAELEKDINLNQVDFKRPIGNMSSADRIAVLQSAGNLLRKKHGNDILAQLCINEIAARRIEHEDVIYGDGSVSPKVKKRRFATLIDSLKHPNEVELLRTIYGDMFYLIGVLCPQSIRKERLNKEKKIREDLAIKLMERDKSEHEEYGQKLLKTILHSDYFVRNTILQRIERKLDRFFKIILGDAGITPTIDESAMYYAQSAAVRSGCMSRKVGAAIINNDGELISIGWNDVPKFKGGLYSEESTVDQRCMKRFGGACENDRWKNDIFNDIKEILLENVGEDTATDISEKIRTHERLRGLIEFCRAIHAEMDAITSAARNGSYSLKGTKMYCTTYPCHNCARHIIASGIEKVFYIEPYEKSLAIDLHADAIEFDPKNLLKETIGQDKVLFLPFEGVAPRRYLELFQDRKRKHGGKIIDVDLKKSKPIIAKLLDRFIDYEAVVSNHLDRIGFKSKPTN